MCATALGQNSPPVADVASGISSGVEGSPITQEETTWVLISYAKSTSDDFVAMEREIWKPFWERMIQSGQRISWTLFEVWNGFDNTYDYVFVHALRDLEDLTSSEVGEKAFQEAHPGADMGEALAKAEAARAIVKTELWQLVEQTGDLHGDVLGVGYMKVPPGGSEEYLSMEREIWEPLWSVAVEEELRTGWAVLEKWFPGGTEYPYDYVAVNSYGQLGDIAAPITDEHWERAHPGADLDAMFERTLGSREMVRTELWRVVDHAH